MDGAPFRRHRVLLALGPPAGTLSALLGMALGWSGMEGVGEVARDLGAGRGWGFLGFMAFLAMALTLAAVGLGMQRSKPFHALKALGLLATLLFVPFWWVGRLCAEWASC